MRRVKVKIPDLDALARKYSQQVDQGSFYESQQAKLNPNHEWWYIFGYTDMGRPVFLGPHVTEDEAECTADEAGLNDVRIKCYTTRNLAEGSRRMKAELLKEMDADEALTRMKHKL